MATPKSKALKKHTQYSLYERGEGKIQESDKPHFGGYDLKRIAKDGKPMYKVRSKTFNVRTI